MVTSHEHGVIGENFDEAGLRQGIEGILDDVDDTVVRLDVGSDDLLSVGGDDTRVEVAPVHNRYIRTQIYTFNLILWTGLIVVKKYLR